VAGPAWPGRCGRAGVVGRCARPVCPAGVPGRCARAQGARAQGARAQGARVAGKRRFVCLHRPVTGECGGGGALLAARKSRTRRSGTAESCIAPASDSSRRASGRFIPCSPANRSGFSPCGGRRIGGKFLRARLERSVILVREDRTSTVLQLSPGTGQAMSQQPSEGALITGQSSGRAAKLRLVFLYQPIPEMGFFQRPFMSFKALSCASSPSATISFRCLSCALITSSAVFPWSVKSQGPPSCLHVIAFIRLVSLHSFGP